MKSRSSNMADSVREQKLAAARKKLRQFQKKKGTKRVADNISKENTPDVEGNATEESSPLSESGTLSSRASSIDLASEEFPDPPQDVRAKVDPFLQSQNAAPVESQTNGEATNYSCSPVAAIETPDDSKLEAAQKPLASGEGNGVNFNNVVHPSTAAVEVTSSCVPTPAEAPQLPINGIQSNSESYGGNYDNPVNGLSSPLQGQPVAAEPGQQQNSLASYFQTPAVQSDPFSFISPTSTGDLVKQVDSPYDALAGSTAENEMITSPTIIEPDEPESQECSEPDNSTAFHEVIPSTPDVSDQPKEVAPEVIAPIRVTDNADRLNAIDSLDGDGSVSSETTASVTTAIHISAGDRQDQPVLKSSSESLRQISLQLSGLMSETDGTVSDSANMTISELERRNSELAALLQQERQTSQQQAQHVDHMKAQLERVEAELNAAQGALNLGAGSGVREIESVRGQLQIHIQTIGILVSEKSELQSSLTHANHALKQRAGEVTELGGRLSASRQRVSELEANLKDLTSQHSGVKTLQGNLSKELDSSKMTNFKFNKQCEELKTSVAELTERLSVKTSDYEQLTTQLTETKSQLAMAQLNVHQMRDGTNDEIRAQLEQVQAAHVESQRQLAACQAALSQARTENTQVASQYQQYTTRLAEETRSLQQKAEQLNIEKETIAASLEEMKSKLEAAQNSTPSPTGISEEEVKTERERFNITIAHLQEDKHQLQEQTNAMTNDNSQLSRLVDQLSNNVEELEMKLERTKTGEVDTSRLLAAMQSDKVAAARALTQNKQLKEQLEELQSGFIIMSNKKLELTEKLEKELHVKKGLHQEIAALNEELSNMKQQVVEREREMTSLKENSDSLGKQLMQLRSQSHMTSEQRVSSEEMTQYQVLVQQMEAKLKASNERIDELMAKNNELHALISEYGKQMTSDSQAGEKLPNGDANDETNSIGNKELLLKITSLTESNQQLETARNQLKIQLEEISKRNTSSSIGVEKTTHPETQDAEFNPESFKKLREAHEALENRFGRCMTQVAELSDDKQNLEHVIQQLQVENDSIGDYITIYQFQRGVMKQQARERELELSSLTHEREEMKIKLATLQELMSSLTRENGRSQPHLLKMETVIKSQPTPMINSIDKVVNGTVEENHVDDTEEASEDSREDTADKVPEGSDVSKPLIPSSSTGTENITNVNEIQEPQPSTDATSTKSPTVQRILDLLNEMEATSQLEHCGLQKFHPCPLCSGKLITV